MYFVLIIISEDELDNAGPSSKKDEAYATPIRTRNIKPEDNMNSKRDQCLCSRCSPRPPLSRKIKRTSGRHNLDHHDDHHNKYRQDIRTVSKSLQGKNPGRATGKSSEACPSSSVGRDDCCTDCEATWTKDKGIKRPTSMSSGAISCRSSINYHHIHDNAYDTKDLATQTNTNNDPMKSKTILYKGSSDSSRNSQYVLGSDNKNAPVVSIDHRCESEGTSSARKTSDLASSGDQHLCGDECEDSSGSLSAKRKTNSSHGAETGVSSNTDYNTSEDVDDDDDEPRCICGLCPVDGDDDDWEDIDDDDDDSLTDMGKNSFHSSVSMSLTTGRAEKEHGAEYVQLVAQHCCICCLSTFYFLQRSFSTCNNFLLLCGHKV